MDNTSQTTESPSAPARGWRFALALVGVLLAAVVVNWFLPGESIVDGPAAEGSTAREVSSAAEGVTLACVLEIPESDKRPRELTVACQGKITVLEAMRQAQTIEPNWRFRYRNSGDDAFVTQLAGLSSGDRSGSYWTYEVNGELANLGVGSQRVGPGDRVLWKFATVRIMDE